MSLPLSQGFGMSGAGAVAAASSFQRALGISHEESRRRSYLVAHKVERIRSTGLGDITALSAGGVERRIAVGSPYSGDKLNSGPGKAEGWFEKIPLILAWKPKTGKHTSNYIDDLLWKEKITSSGRKSMEKISEGSWDKSRWQELIELAEKLVS
jgi:pantoate kinase